METSLPAVTIYTDGSHNPGKYPQSPGGWAAVFCDPATADKSSSILKGSARNVTDSGSMEVTAVIKALESLDTPHAVQLFCDLQPLTELMQAYCEHPNQRAALRAEFIGNPDDRRVAHDRSLFPTLFDQLDRHDVHVFEVRAHSGNYGNEIANDEAKRACRAEGMAIRAELKRAIRLKGVIKELLKQSEQEHDDPGAMFGR